MRLMHCDMCHPKVDIPMHAMVKMLVVELDYLPD